MVWLDSLSAPLSSLPTRSLDGKTSFVSSSVAIVSAWAIGASFIAVMLILKLCSALLSGLGGTSRDSSGPISNALRSSILIFGLIWTLGKAWGFVYGVDRNGHG